MVDELLDSYQHSLEIHFKALSDARAAEGLPVYALEHGLDAETPAAAINQGTRPEQRVLSTTLKCLAEDISTAQITGATLLVIGKVAGLADQLAWFPKAAMPDAQAK